MGDPAAALAARSGANFLSPALFEPLARQLVALAEATSADTLLDLACGSAVVARIASEEVGAAIVRFGLDLSGERLRAAARGSARLAQGNAQALPFRSKTFSLVACQHGLMFFADRSRALREMHRVLIPGGRLVASAWLPLEANPAFRALNHAIDAELGAGPAAAAAQVPFSLCEPSTLVREASCAGFEDVTRHLVRFEARFPSARAFVLQFVRSTSLAPLVPEASRHALASRVERHLEEYGSGGPIRVPASAYIVRAWA